MILCLLFTGCSTTGDSDYDTHGGKTRIPPRPQLQPTKTFQYDHKVRVAEEPELIQDERDQLQEWYQAQGKPGFFVLVFVGNQNISQVSYRNLNVADAEIKGSGELTGDLREYKEDTTDTTNTSKSASLRGNLSIEGTSALRLWIPEGGRDYFIANSVLRSIENSIVANLTSLRLKVIEQDIAALRRIDSALGDMQQGVSIDSAKIRSMVSSEGNILMITELSLKGDYLEINQRLIDLTDNSIIAISSCQEYFVSIDDAKAQTDWFKSIITKTTNKLLRQLVK